MEIDDLRLSILGPPAVRRAGREVPVGPRQQRLILALLLARAGGLVETHEFVRLLWAGDPPPTATNMIHRYVGGLRRILEPGLPPRTAGKLLQRDAGGYRLVLPESAGDLLEFRAAVTAARRAAGLGDDQGALNLLLAGLRLWKGRVAAGLGGVAEVCPALIAIERERADAVRSAADAALRCGGQARILPVLREAVTRDPLDEDLQARLLLVLAADGKQAEAVARYGEVRRRLADELGAEPGPELRSAFQAVLRTGHTELETPAARTAYRPAQLPLDLRLFVGRAQELRAATAALTEPGPGVPIVAFDGVAGVGKSTLAVHLGHRLEARFPDGQLYVDLHGRDAGQAADPGDVLHQFLLALGVDPQLVPADPEPRAALYRSLTAGRRMLVVLDDAATGDQIRPLLPGTGGNAVLVTSRRRLSGLSAGHGARLLGLAGFPAADGRACLERRIGTARTAAEPAAVDEIVERCGGLPLALALVAARAATDEELALGAIAAELVNRRETLQAFADETMDVDLRSVFAPAQGSAADK